MEYYNHIEYITTWWLVNKQNIYATAIDISQPLYKRNRITTEYI